MGRKLFLFCLWGVALLGVGRATAQTTRTSVAVDASTLRGKVICGYQGWFNTPTDGAGRGWVHWGQGAMAPGRASVELLPDVSELGPEERFTTGFKHADGSPVEVFSSYVPQTVERHFEWMRAYGIDGVFLQRFASGIGDRGVMRHYDRILDNVRKGAAKNGRAWGLMYDLSGVKAGEAGKVIADFKALVDATHCTQDAGYLRDGGKPIVALWGLGFPDRESNLIPEGMELIRFLHDDPAYGGNKVLIGVPGGWRTLTPDKGDSREAFERLLLAADIVQPWAVGSFAGLGGVKANSVNRWAPDMAWCAAHGRTYMPVVFPGFSWNNLKPGATYDQIPRLRGAFLRAQFAEVARLHVTCAYVAMFDEVDEGTAIFKVTNDVPVAGASRFLTLDGLASDAYLKIVGEGTRLVRGAAQR